MATSNVKKLSNEINTIEEESDRYISSDKYYIVNLTVSEVNKRSFFLETSKKMLFYSTNRPLAVYIFGNCISLIYSCTEEDQLHYAKGSHHRIISEFVSFLSLELKTFVTGRLIELDSRIEIVTYFIWKSHFNSLKSIVDTSKGCISNKDVKEKTFKELISILTVNSLSWGDVPSQDKYGIFYKLKNKKGKLLVSELTEFFDSRETKKYSNFLFN